MKERLIMLYRSGFGIAFGNALPRFVRLRLLILVILVLFTGVGVAALSHAPAISIDYFFLFVGIGMLAQLIDGALGMAYGVTVTSILNVLGLPFITPSVSTASMHASEVMTTGFASFWYMKYKNINRRLFAKLVLPGILGAVCGAIFIVFFSKEFTAYIKPIVAVYTGFLGTLILLKAIRPKRRQRKIRNIGRTAVLGGFLDTVGGGGWGPIVTTSLIAGGRNLRYSVGTSHLAKFFVAAASTFLFFAILGIQHIYIIAGLILGSALVTPFSIYISTKIAVKPAMILVGSVVVLLSLRTLIFSIF